MAKARLIDDSVNNELLEGLKRIQAKRDLLEEIYSGCSCYLDNNFKREFNSQCKYQTYSRLWELVICYGLLNSSLNLSLGKNKKKGGHPDFSLLNYPLEESTTWIECVCVNEGTNYTPCPDKYKERIHSAIKDKSEKIIAYKSEGIIKATDMVILAINSGLLGEQAFEDAKKVNIANPDLVSTILGQHVMYFDTNEEPDHAEEFLPHDIQKTNGTIIGVGTLKTYPNLKDFNLLVCSKTRPFMGLSTKNYELLFHSERDAKNIAAGSLFHFWPDPEGIVDLLGNIASAIQTNMGTKI